ncbi:MAG TPA: hypothetical protein VIH99_12915 [Bdellovibrionota bacterium]|jgi:hypothetical protein
MINRIAALTILSLFTACASQTPKPKYVEEKNQAKYSSSRALAENPDKVLRAARAVLDNLTHESNPPSGESVKGDDDSTVYTGWVYSTSKDKYVQYDFNGSPRRKPLALRRIYGFTVTPGLSGSQVTMNVEEEVQEIDLKSGSAKGWKRVETETAAYDMLLRRLTEKVRQE